MLSQKQKSLTYREAKLYSIVQKSFKKQRKYFEENVQDLYENHVLVVTAEYNILQNENVNLFPKKGRENEVRGNDPMDGFRRAMWLYEMIEDLQLPIEKVFERWYKTQYRKFARLLSENGIDYYPNLPSDYANKRGDLQLSNYKWTISHTTKRDVISVLKEWIDNNESWGTIQRRIYAVDDKLFGLPRARAIAVTETAKAYEYGNRQPIQALQDAWIEMEKKWLTVWDDRVRPEHMECENEGRVPIDYNYPSVGVDMPPWGVNCRCTLQYQRKR